MRSDEQSERFLQNFEERFDNAYKQGASSSSGLMNTYAARDWHESNTFFFSSYSTRSL